MNEKQAGEPCKDTHKGPFRIYGQNWVGFATCTACHDRASDDVHLVDAFNTQLEQFEKALDRLDEAIEKARKG